MQYKALAVDVDGTLLCGSRPWLTEPCLSGLRDLQSRGIPVIICTGRGGFAAQADTLSGFQADYMVCANGACIINSSGETIHAEPFSLAQVNTLTECCERYDSQLAFAFEDAYYIYNGYNEFVVRYREESGDSDCLIDCTSSRDRHLKSLPLGSYALMIPDAAKEIIKALPDLRFMETAHNAYDICRAGMNKAIGLGWLLQQLGIKWDEVVAIGDSVNDLEMLRAAGVGVAMGNAPEIVVEASDYVTGTVLEDGILEPMNRFF